MQNVSVRTAVPVRAQQRQGRYPKCKFRLANQRPYQIKPFMIHPVLPGETLQRATLQARAKTDAIAPAADLLGWWLEHYVFYVKLTDLAGRDDFTEMLLDATKDLSAYDAAANQGTYHAGHGLDWTALCVDRIVDEYFRDEDDGTVQFDGMHQAAIEGESFLNSVKLDSVVSNDADYLPGEEQVVPDHLTAFSDHYSQWQAMREMNLVSATFEDWVKAFGVATDTKPQREDYRPELIRYSRDWQYPSTVVDGGSGGTTSAVVWSIAETADKKRLFKEPGFIVGVTVARPKVYLSKQVGAAVSMMNDAYAWLPATMRDNPFTSLKQFATSTGANGPLGDTPTEEYWIDVRDLLIYGDQFHDMAGSEAGFVDLPTASVQRRYAAETQIDALFNDAAGGNKYIKQDGVLNLNILSHQRDET